MSSPRTPVASTPPLSEGVDQLSRMMNAGDFAAAIALTRALIRKHPKEQLLHNVMGVAQAQSGHTTEAIRAFRRAIDISPAYDEALGNLISTMIQAGQTSEAIPYLTRALTRDPDDTGLRQVLAEALKADGDLDGTLAQTEQILKSRPTDIHALQTRGDALQELARLDEAATQFDAILAQAPTNGPALLAKASIQAARGQIDKALAAIHLALTQNPDQIDAYQLIASIHKFQPDDPMIDDMQARFDAPQTNAADRLKLGFALGKAYADIGAYDRVFAPLNAGNAEKRKLVEPYSHAKRRKNVQRLKSLFTRASVARLSPTVANDSKSPIFVVGMPRSGTTLIEQILSSHSNVFGAGELEDFGTLGKALLATTRMPDTATLKAFADTYLAHLKTLSGGKADHVIDKMPANADWVGLILTLFPNAKIIRTRRDPRDTGLSIYQALFQTTGLGWAYDLQDIGRYHLLHDELMDHWTAQFPDAIFDCDYEELVTNPEPMIRQMAAFCDLTWEDALLAPHKNKRAVLTASIVQARKPINPGSVQNWTRYESDLAPMIKALSGSGSKP